jgi:hypothetical protein
MGIPAARLGDSFSASRAKDIFEVIEEFAFPVRYRVFEGRSNAVLKPSCGRTLAVIATG